MRVSALYSSDNCNQVRQLKWPMHILKVDSTAFWQKSFPQLQPGSPMKPLPSPRPLTHSIPPFLSTPREAVVHSEETWGPQGDHSGNKHHPSET